MSKNESKEIVGKESSEKEIELEDGHVRMTASYIQELCKSQKLFVTPSLNDKLYLHLQGFKVIENLESYSKVQSLFLGSNRIRNITGLDHLSNSLRCLFIQKNMIKDISKGLEKLKELSVLDLSYNFVTVLPETIQHNTNLQTLNLSYNRIFHSKDLTSLSFLRNLEVLDLQHNRIEDGDIISNILKNLPKLKVLYLFGNPFVRTMKNYRKTVISTLPELNYLDTRPITKTERKCVEAWKEGGIEAERKMKERIRKERDERERLNRKKNREIAQKAHEKRIRREKQRKIGSRICKIVRENKFDWKEISLVIDTEFGIKGDGSSFPAEVCRELFVEFLDGRKNLQEVEEIEPSWDELTIVSFRNILEQEK